MKVFLSLLLILACANAFAANKLGVGVMLGNPTGINGKYWLGSGKAVDGGFGLSLGKTTEVNLHSDYLFHKEGAFFFQDVHSLDLYYGVGGRMEFSDSIELGVRLPVGLAHEVKDQPADVFAEVAPIVDFIGRTGLELSLAVGGRYYF